MQSDKYKFTYIPAGPDRPSLNIRVTRGKVSSHNFAFSPADTKSIEISGLPEQEKVVLTREISPFADSAKSKRMGFLINRTLHGKSSPCLAAGKPIFTGDFTDWQMRDRTLCG